MDFPIRSIRVCNDVWIPALVLAEWQGTTLTDKIVNFLAEDLRAHGIGPFSEWNRSDG